MSPFLERLHREIERWDIAGVTASAAELTAKLDTLRLRHDALMGEVPFWARAAFFIDTDEEERARAVRAEMASTRAHLTQLDDDLDARLQRVGEQLAPFGVALDVERCVRAARGILSGQGASFDSIGDRAPLLGALDALTDRVLTTWVPDLDLDAIASLGKDPVAARSAARDAAADFEPDDYTCWRPITHARLAGVVASSLIDSGLFERRDDAELDASVEEAHAELEVASQGVSLLDRVNVFSTSDAESSRDAAAQELVDARWHEEYTLEMLGYEVASSIGLFPPLATARAARALRGALHTLEAQRFDTLAADGDITRGRTIAYAATMLAAAARLRDSVTLAFPGMPRPCALVGEAPTSVLDDSSDAWLDPFFSTLDASDAPRELARSLAHASMNSVLLARTRRNAEHISAYDRLVFWDDTDAEEREKRLEGRRAWHLAALERSAVALTAHARAASARHPILGMRDGAVHATRAIDAIHTDSGQSSSPKSCSVYGSVEAYTGLRRIRAHLESHFHTTGSRRDLMRSVRADLDAGRSSGSPPEPFAPLSYGELSSRLAGALEGTDFAESFGALERLEAQRRSHAQAASQAEERISLWDKINVFSRTDDERARDELRQDMGELDEEMSAFVHVDAMFDDVLRQIYPPAELAYSLDGVFHAVGSIRAVCRSTTVTTGTGDNKRTETRYYCALVGHSAAAAAVRRFNRRFVSAWGDLPDHHSLLARWAARAAASRLTAYAGPRS